MSRIEVHIKEPNEPHPETDNGIQVVRSSGSLQLEDTSVHALILRLLFIAALSTLCLGDWSPGRKWHSTLLGWMLGTLILGSILSLIASLRIKRIRSKAIIPNKLVTILSIWSKLLVCLCQTTIIVMLSIQHMYNSQCPQLMFAGGMLAFCVLAEYQPVFSLVPAMAYILTTVLTYPFVSYIKATIWIIFTAITAIGVLSTITRRIYLQRMLFNSVSEKLLGLYHLKSCWRR